MSNAIISSTKFDGSLHYRFESLFLSASENEIRLYTPPHIEMTTYRGELKTTSHSLRIFYTDRNWNVMVRWHADWRFEEFYVNIASPATWDGRVLNWVDMDLDIILHAGKTEPMLDDEDEFVRHQKKWNYPEKTVADCWAAVEEAWGKMKRADAPFDAQMTAWRPSV